MEVLSATDWALNKSVHQFNPNTYVEVGKEAIDKKIEALAQYRGCNEVIPIPAVVKH